MATRSGTVWMAYPRLVMWQLLFMVTLLLNIFLLYTIVAPWAEDGCPAVATVRRNDMETPQRPSVRIHDGADVHPSREVSPEREKSAPLSKRSVETNEPVPLAPPKPAAQSRELPPEHEYTTGKDCSAEAKGSLDMFLCKVEAANIFYSPHSNPIVIAKDVTRERYFARRDLQGWTLAFNNISFTVSEIPYRRAVTLADLSVFLCLSVASQDRHCMKPSFYYGLHQGQRFNQINGIRDSLWRKDGMCLTMRQAIGTLEDVPEFTFPCWVLPVDREIFRVCYPSPPQPPHSLILSPPNPHTL